MALAFLPAAHIRPVFRQLKMRASSQKLVDLCDYMERQWMSHSIFTVVSWCVFNQSVRTNNNVEGWHRRMNLRTSDQQLGLYKLIPALHKQASLLSLHAQLLHYGKLTRFVKKSASADQAEIFAAWRLYKEGQLSPTGLLTMCSRVYAPSVFE
ncbi:uncharacterized protein LOC124261553 [Haliotis rubra]|uniref:uncharacterized protein LOC124261553 n=1 Tax=Haliotis rubra TaxID=36100 RepID=UPI001EE51981|nr:uncharacterized protein LOC124261553 [Haliotis rubra]